ncbi:hypothetical protein HH1059_25460 [Halorhodospira halochloris]|uniref:Transporter n=1 Tax=Halorhodospira halochloris TaxID=1052 RepID=A0A0X8X7U7_HALHR|nr:hypothetical protein [Halorhodospira halochloris]MBK1650873.1 hypothetical protein [Halorhodospira halochloris]MCG5547227.1 hypothetical protein [Halorhodospira halochloris]BAU56627.1 hypothetical protein HH1059_25460 [Halorhodospira halochloris]
MSRKVIGALLGVGLTFAGQAAAQADQRPLLLSPATVIGSHQTDIFAGMAYQLAREDDGDEYDNLLVGPVGVRHGLTDQFEYGVYFTFVRNYEQDEDAPDDSGHEGLTAYGKLELTENMALEFGTTLNGDDEIKPYPNDGIDFFVNLPMQRALGDNLVYGEVGYTIKENRDVSVKNYLNWGFGYAHHIEEGVSLNLEFVGDENPTGDNHMDMLFGASLQFGQANVRPYMGIGIYDDSPDLSAGVNLNWRL